MDKAGSVFRPEAIRRYHGGREKTVLPLLGAPRVGLFVWIAAGLLFSALGFAAFAEVPVYVRGSAVPVGAPDAEGTVTAVAVLPTESLPRLKVGQRAFMETGPGGGVGAGAVTNPAPRLVSPVEIDAQLKALEGVSAPTKSVVVVSARFAGAPPPDSPRGPRVLWVEVGSRRLGSLIGGMAVMIFESKES